LLASSGPALATQDASLFALAPPPAGAPSALLAHAAEDPSLRATILPERAVLSLDTGGAGELALHLRVKDGVADVRVSGSAADALDVRPSELRAALASEGLSLGSFESGQAPSRHADADPSDRAADARPSIPAVATISSNAAAAAAGEDRGPTAHPAGPRGVHVTA